MENNRNIVKYSSGLSTTGLLGLAFIILKLVGVIDWSWWWVTAPFWIPVILFMLIIAVVVIVAAIRDYKENRRRHIQ